MGRETNGTSKNKKVRRAAENVIMVCLALLVLISGFKVYTILKSYRDNRAVYDKVSESGVDEEKGIDFAALREINPDVIGWLRYEGTPIDYPVVKGADNDKYLYTLFDGSYGVFGTIFADCITERPFRQFNTIVYGHHMKDGSMFAGLSDLKDPAYCREHPELELFTPDGDYRLVIWAFLNQPSDSRIYNTNIADEEAQAEYIENVRGLAEYTTGTDPKSGDSLVLLSTCAYEYQDARYIVVCRMVPEE